MEILIQKSITDEAITKAGKFYGVSFDSIKYVGGFENFVYQYSKEERDYILRLVHSHHRSSDLVLAELEFIDYLDNNDAQVSTVVHSINDNLIEIVKIDDKHYFTVCVFTKAPGRKVQKDDLNDEFYQNFGKEIGKLHRLTKTYNPIHKRQHWHEESYLDQARNFLPEKDAKIVDIYDDLIKKIKNLPQNISNYGLIHTDLHFGNMFISSGELTFFDWDDASYKHFISDIAIVIFYRLAFGDMSREEINTESGRMIRNLMIGYRKENKLNIDEFKMLNEFLLLRTIILYIVIYAEGEEKNEAIWAKTYLEKYKDRIINKIPFLDIEKVLENI